MSDRAAPHPLLLEANARLLLRRLAPRVPAVASGGPSLAAVPADLWREVVGPADLLWPMGVWTRSAASRAEALRIPELRRAYDAALPGWSEEDVAGSPYAVAAYALDPRLGAPGDLALLHRRLGELGVGLVLDFVPNHVARDHPWTRKRPDLLVRASERDLRAHPERYYRTDAGVWIAHGRDPYFAPWTDTAQIDLFAPATRAALVHELLAIAEVCDGVRCDMAMLALSDVFERTWEEAEHAPRPAGELWAEAIERVRARRPGFRFLAEGYWGLERRLVELGFDHVYDKTLYDRLRAGTAADVRAHLAGSGAFVARGAHFVENHDEERAAVAFGERLPAALATVLTLPGLRLLHDGQRDGRRTRAPVQLVREPDEPPDPTTRALHDRLLAATSAPAFRSDAYELLDAHHASVLAWRRGHGPDARLVVVNLSPEPVTTRLALPAGSAAGPWSDVLSGEALAVTSASLDVTLAPWSARIAACAGHSPPPPSSSS